MKKGNKGEWSEFYVFLRLLADGKLYTADADLNKIENIYYPILKIIRRSESYKKPLYYEIKNENIIIVDSKRNIPLKQVSSGEFSINADKLLKIIGASVSSFQVAAIQEFIAEIQNPLIKENAASKRDITVVIHDINTGYKPQVGFSIKSKMGGASTLFNANVTNNFLYKIKGLEKLDQKVLEVLKDLTTKALLTELKANNCSIDFESVMSSCFQSNLQMIDSSFPLILAEILKLYYCGYSKKICDITKKIAEINPCSFKNNEVFSFYEYKIKMFLIACALGMTSAKAWNGSFDVSGGYIIVKKNGDVVCYHIYNWNAFQEYLFNNTYIDTPSTNRHKFGKLEGNKLNLNFQIRFN